MVNGNIIGFDEYGNPIYDNMQPNDMGCVDMMPNYNIGNFDNQGFDPNYDMGMPQNYGIGMNQGYDMGMMNNGMFIDTQPN